MVNSKSKVLFRATNLHKIYGRKNNAFAALRGINLDIYDGESIAITGKSGSGKSTLMHLLALLDRPSSGNIYLSGLDTSHLSARRLNYLRNKSFGFVFQSFFMNANDSVLNNVMLPLKIAGISRAARKKRALDALETVGLADKAKNKANDLSGGQKQRVCLARAIVNRPKVIFADEPTGNLDSYNGERVVELLFKLNQEQGITLVIVTHDPDLAARCEREVHIADGVIISKKEAQK